MKIENLVIDTVPDDHEEKQEFENPSKESFMKTILVKRGEYILPNSFVLPSLDVCLLGEVGTVLVPQPNVLPIIGMGNKDLKCSKCGYVLALKVKRLQVQSIAIKCPSCDCMNQF